MKFEKNKKYFTMSIYAFGVIAASIVFFFILLYPEKLFGFVTRILSILAPIIIGFVLAYIFNPMMNFFENTVLGKIPPSRLKKKGRRVISLIVTYIIILGILTLFFATVIPSLAASLTDLLNNIQDYYGSAVKFLTNLFKKYNLSTEALDSFNDLGTKLVSFTVDALKSLLPRLYGMTLSVTDAVKNIVIGFAFSIYMLASKEVFQRQILKLMAIFVKPHTRIRITNVAHLTNQTFSKYLSGYILDSTIVGIVCYLVMLIFGWPYPALISIMIGVTNMIPFFGPTIGAIPSILLIFLVNPWEALFFGIFIIILQQIDGNIICPRILGQRVGLSAFWVMVAIVVGGSLFGITGMLLSVPAFAVIYSLVRSVLNRRLKKVNLAKEENANENL